MTLTAKKRTSSNSMKEKALLEIKKEKNMKLNVDVPESKHLAFAIKCKLNKTTMSNVIRNFINEYTV